MATTKGRRRGGGRGTESLNAAITAAERQARADQATLRAVERMARAVGRREVTARAVAREDLLDEVKRLCAEYQRWRATIVQAISWIARIPFIGSTLASALRFLVQVLDAICSVIS
jgi:hypothetical protein